jgi:hypothetical protein
VNMRVHRAGGGGALLNSSLCCRVEFRSFLDNVRVLRVEEFLCLDF